MWLYLFIQLQCFDLSHSLLLRLLFETNILPFDKVLLVYYEELDIILKRLLFDKLFYFNLIVNQPPSMLAPVLAEFSRLAYLQLHLELIA